MVKLFKQAMMMGFLALLTNSVTAQGYNQEQIQLAKFIERMYNNAPFDGCRIVDDYDNSYLLSVVTLDKAKHKNPQVMNRVAEVKSQRNAGEFFNGSQSYSQITIRTPKSKEKGGETDMTEVYELIRTNSMGYVRQMQLLTLFDGSEGTKVFVYYKKVDNNNPKQ